LEDKKLTKFISHISGKIGKAQKNYTSYRVEISNKKLKEAGFILNDGTVLECDTKVVGKTIVLEHKEFKD
jgi:hypothetical protein